MTAARPGYRISYALPHLPFRRLDMWSPGEGRALADFRSRPWIVREAPAPRHGGNTQIVRHRDYASARRHTDLWLAALGGGEIAYLGTYDAAVSEEDNRARLIAAAVVHADVADVEDAVEGDA